jgi:hypothetical protein
MGSKLYILGISFCEENLFLLLHAVLAMTT